MVTHLARLATERLGWGGCFRVARLECRYTLKKPSQCAVKYDQLYDEIYNGSTNGNKMTNNNNDKNQQNPAEYKQTNKQK